MKMKENFQQGKLWECGNNIKNQTENQETQLQKVQKSQDTDCTQFNCDKCGRTHGLKECSIW